MTVSANKYYDIAKYGDPARKRYTDRYKAIVFFMRMCLARCERIAVENPVGIMSTAYRKPDQIIQPFMFGDEARKATCLWLKHLPPLMATEIASHAVERSAYCNNKIKNIPRHSAGDGQAVGGESRLTCRKEK